MEVNILSTGVANVASVVAAFKRLNCKTKLISDAHAVTESPFLVLPGVGSFQSGMASLVDKGLVDALRVRISDGRPTLAICLGLQLLAEASEESPGVRGLSCIASTLTAFPNTVASPQFGWNWLSNENAPVLGDGGYVYYANSYRMTECPDGWGSGWTEYGGPFVGCLQKGAVVACQFHPELSGEYGSTILANWLNDERRATC
ncbi:MAG: imidazole glycerol phosphate synthase subunit HisH [Myxococcales bacterium]|nr:imidazole glycerol phosphate synthase subunit HisH [Myxococcales bacterium]